jgi:hypothetical protein
MKIAIFLFSFVSASVFGATVTLQCGDSSFLNSVKVGNITVDFVTEPKKEDAPSAPSEKIKALAHLVRVALTEGADPYALMALHSIGKGTTPASGLSVARTLACPTRIKTDMKHFSAAELATLSAARSQLQKITSERSKINGGDDFEEWTSLQKEIDKMQRSTDDIRAKLPKLTGDKKEEALDQINDNNEEVKGLKKEQEDYTKSPGMKRIVALEAEKISVRQKIDGIRLKAVQAVSEDEKDDVTREFDCLKSETCQGVLLKSDKVENIDLSLAGETAATPENVCLGSEALNSRTVEFAKNGCCASVKTSGGSRASDAVLAVAAARGLRDTFTSCTSRPAENDCFAKYLEFKGECAHAEGTKMAVQLVSEFLANTEVNTMVAAEARSLKKPVVSSFCTTRMNEAVTVDDGPFALERKKFVALHKSCK